jgi:hypothetical protein
MDLMGMERIDRIEGVEAKQLISDVERQRGRARKALGVYWFPLIVFGGIALFGAIVTATAAPPVIFALWIAAWPSGMIATAIYYGRRAHRIGLSAPPLPFIVTGLCLGLGAGLLGWLGRDSSLGSAGPLLVIGAGYLVFAWLQRSLLEGALALTLVGAAIFFLVFRPLHAGSLSLAFFGLASLVIGAWNLRQSSSAE